MLKVVRENLVDLPTNLSLSYFWCGGFMISFFLIVQVVTGVILSFLYVSDSLESFYCVIDLSKDSLLTWFIRYFHMWGVSYMFFLLFVHMARGLYYSSYSKLGVWNVGFLLYLLMMAEAFLGYILPWHQMSYWAATVITSILQSVPVWGDVIYRFMVGGFSVTNITLLRVFAAHMSVAFLMLGFSVVHLFYLHLKGSKDPLFSGGGYCDAVLFHGFYTSKDGLCLVFLVFSCVLFLLVSPDLVLDVESYVEANPMVTPVAIKPEWYFLAYYAMLRSMESKVGGLVLVLVFLVLLWLPSVKVSCAYSGFRQLVFWVFCSFFVLLSYLGACHPEYPFFFISQAVSLGIVFVLFLFKAFWLVSYGYTLEGCKGLY